MGAQGMPRNAPASWSVGLGLLSMVLLWLLWPASPVVAVAAIACGALGVRESRRGGNVGRSRALVGISYGALTLLVLCVILVVATTAD